VVLPGQAFHDSGFASWGTQQGLWVSLPFRLTNSHDVMRSFIEESQDFIVQPIDFPAALVYVLAFRHGV